MNRRMCLNRRTLAPTRITFIRPRVKQPFAKRWTDEYIKRHTTIGLSLPDDGK